MSAFLILSQLAVTEFKLQASTTDSEGAPFPPAPTYAMWAPQWVQGWWEYCGPDCSCSASEGRGSPCKRGKLRRHQGTALPPLNAQLLNWHVTQKEVYHCPHLTAVPWLRDFDKAEKQAVKEIALSLFPKSWLHLQQKMENLKPKGALKNSPSYIERQQGRDSRYRQNCSPPCL